MLFLESYNFMLKSLLNSVVKCGLAFQIKIYLCKCYVYKMCITMLSNLSLQILLAAHVCMITKTCRFAARRARPATYKGGFLGEMCAPSHFHCNNTLCNNNILSTFYVHLTSKRSPARNCSAISGPRCQMQ